MTAAAEITGRGGRPARRAALIALLAVGATSGSLAQAAAAGKAAPADGGVAAHPVPASGSAWPQGFALQYKPQAKGFTQLQILAPETTEVEVSDKAVSGALAASARGPLLTLAVAGHTYQVLLRGAEGAEWQQAVVAKKGRVAVLAAGGEGTADGGRRGPPARPAGSAVLSGPAPMPDDDFGGLIDSVRQEPFADDQREILSAAARAGRFSCDQAGQLIDLFVDPEDKLRTLTLLRPKLTDPQNAPSLATHFSGPEPRAKAQRILGTP